MDSRHGNPASRFGLIIPAKPLPMSFPFPPQIALLKKNTPFRAGTISVGSAPEPLEAYCILTDTPAS